jgi:hypothetical protein
MKNRGDEQSRKNEYNKRERKTKGHSTNGPIREKQENKGKGASTRQKEKRKNNTDGNRAQKKMHEQGTRGRLAKQQK